MNFTPCGYCVQPRWTSTWCGQWLWSSRRETFAHLEAQLGPRRLLCGWGMVPGHLWAWPLPKWEDGTEKHDWQEHSSVGALLLSQLSALSWKEHTLPHLLGEPGSPSLGLALAIDWGPGACTEERAWASEPDIPGSDPKVASYGDSNSSHHLTQATTVFFISVN